jgi:uncharacterized protein YggU (UPF0235/DUF167 family)
MTQVVGWLGDALKIKVAAPPEKGRANEAVVSLLAERIGVNRRCHRHQYPNKQYQNKTT